MVNTPKTRHSKARRERPTIELDPADVSRVSDVDAVVEAGDSSSSPVAASVDAPASREPDAAEAIESSLDTDRATETGTSTPPEQDYQPAEAAQAASQYRFEEAEPPKSSEQSHPTGYGSVDRPPPPTESGFSRIAAGIVGAVVALAGAGVLQYAGVLGSPGAGSDSAEIAALRQEVSSIKNAASGGDNSAQVNELGSSLDGLKAEVAAMKESLSTGAGGESAGLQALDSRIKELETSIANLGKGGTADAEGLSELGERVAATETLARTASEAATANDGKLSALETSVGGLTSRVDAQAQQPKIALAISSAALKSAIERGEPFTAELETFAAITPNAPQIAALRSYAADGVFSRADIAAAADTAVDAMLASTMPATANEGFFDRLMSSAEKMVTVRRVGDPEGPGVPETLARMESAVKRGDYTKALAEYASLPQPVQDAGADFAAKLKARLDVETQLDALIAGAMKA